MLTLDSLRDQYYYHNNTLYDKKTLEPIVTYASKRGKIIYQRVILDGKYYYLHRLIFWLENGYLPKLIDHKDRDGSNNSLENLRDISHSLNLLNTGLKSSNTSGYTGVRWNKKSEKWIARINFMKKAYHIGCFDSLEEAVNARREKETSLFKEA